MWKTFQVDEKSHVTSLKKIHYKINCLLSLSPKLHITKIWEKYKKDHLFGNIYEFE